MYSGHFSEDKRPPVGRKEVDEKVVESNLKKDYVEGKLEEGEKKKKGGDSSEMASPGRRMRRASSGRRNKSWLDITSIICLFLMSISFICGASFVHPYSQTALGEPFSFWLIGTIFYIIVGGLDIVKRKSKGVLEVVASWIGLLGGIVWCVGSIFLLNATANLTLWGGLWIAGSLLNLYVVTYDIVMLFKNPVKYLFRAIALALAWLANLLFLSGATHLVVLASGGAFICDIVNASGILISGAVMLFIHSVFQTLPLFMDNFTFSIVLARSEV
jgi:hypothetical protein